MASEVYKLGRRGPSRRRRFLLGGLAFVTITALIIIGIILVLRWLQPHTAITQSAAHAKRVEFNSLRHYDEPDFGIDLPISWKAIAKPVGQNQSYSWQSAELQTDGQTLEVYEDAPQATFPVNRLLVVASRGSSLSVKGQASANCTSFTPSAAPLPGQLGVPATWQGVAFLCDQRNQPRIVTGTGSNDGINTVSLNSPSKGTTHHFFFTYVNYNSADPNYSVFYNALSSFRLK